MVYDVICRIYIVISKSGFHRQTRRANSFLSLSQIHKHQSQLSHNITIHDGNNIDEVNLRQPWLFLSKLNYNIKGGSR